VQLLLASNTEANLFENDAPDDRWDIRPTVAALEMAVIQRSESCFS
jgi:hypothetical protein